MEQEYLFNPITNKTPYGASLKSKAVNYVLKINKSINTTAVLFNYCYDGSNQEKCELMNRKELADCIEYSVSIKFNEEGLYWYCFQVYQNDHYYFLQRKDNFDVEPVGENPSRFQQLVYSKINTPNTSYNKGVMYHIFVDRFCKSGNVKPHTSLVLRDDWGGEITKNSLDFKVINKECFGGNLKGIISKLNYLKSLNVTTIYLSPIFEANSYHKYDTADYSKIDSMFGDINDLTMLIEKAKQKGINVILDGVFNHTGDDSIYFNRFNTYSNLGACQGEKSPYYSWYSFTDFPNKYDSWWGIDCMPQIKDDSPSFTKFLCGKSGILQKYMKLGLLGFRLDVVDELEENKLNEICASIRSVNPNALIVGEVWEDASNKIAYSKRRKYFLGKELNSVMNYPLKDAIINYVTTRNCENLKNTIYMLKDHYPKEVTNNLMNILGTHDSSRIMSVLKHSANIEDDAISLLKIASLLQFTIMGVPCIFYGDEQGLEGEGAPFCRVCFPLKDQNENLIKWYKFLGLLRNNESFCFGELNIIKAENGVFGFERIYNNEKFVIYTNCGGENVIITLTEKLTNFETKKQVSGNITLKSNSYLILKK